jgi:hypothetical protein
MVRINPKDEPSRTYNKECLTDGNPAVKSAATLELAGSIPGPKASSELSPG